MTSERLQRLIARSGLASRRKAELLIREGRVTVNGQVAEIGEKADPTTDTVRVDGRRIRPPKKHRYLLLNKPRGCVTTHSDPQGRKTVFDLVPVRFRQALVAAGRLDFDSEGLLVLTDDGDLVQRITHPRYGCIKIYAVKVRGVPIPAKIERLRRGMVINGQRTAPARIHLRRGPRQSKGEKNSWWTVQLVEGRKRQIREMFHRIGHPVQRLMRVGIGDVADSQLPVGAIRELSHREVEILRHVSSKDGKVRRKKRSP